MKRKREVLAFIPARAGSKRIPGKNTKLFLGKPLIAHTILQARSSSLIDRIIVSTESPRIASVAKRYGAEVPFLRPRRMAGDTSHVVDSLLFTLKTLKEHEGYEPTHVVILQTTSPLREEADIAACFALMKKTKATTTLTVAPTHPILCHLSASSDLVIANGSARNTSTHAWRAAYLLNGCAVYVIATDALLRERQIHTRKTKAVVMPKWRSIDLDDPEEWMMAEILMKHKKQIRSGIKKITHEKK